MPGIAQFSSLTDLVDDQKFDDFYKSFEKVLEKEKTHGTINCVMDFIIRVCLPAFAEGASMVLSDFDTTDRTIIPRLLAIAKAGSRYLGVPVNQVIMPLYESKEDADGWSGLFNFYLTEIEALVHDATTSDEYQKIKDTFFTSEGYLRIGDFSGPSDLTLNMGGQSLGSIGEIKQAVSDQYDEFYNRVAAKLTGIKPTLKQDYGIGSASKRGGGGKICRIQQHCRALVSSMVLKGQNIPKYLDVCRDIPNQRLLVRS